MDADSASPVLGERLPTLRGAGVELRWLDENDIPALFELFSDPEVIRYTSLRRLDSLANAAEMLADIQRLFADRTLFQWGVVRAGEPDRVVATCTLADLAWQHRRAEVGFAVARREWGRRLMSAALPVLLAHAFEDLRLHRLEADADPRNTASLRLLERAGFRREGLLRERYVQAGELQDAVVFGLLAHEWRAALVATP